MEEEFQRLIVDAGSNTTKVGFSGDDSPKAVFPSLVGRVRTYSVGLRDRNTYVGDEAQAKRGVLALSIPVGKKGVTNWDNCEALLTHSFYNELCVAPEEHTVLLTDSSFNTKADRERVTQLLFETFSVPAFYLANQAVLSLLESGRTTGVVLDAGEGVATAVSVYEGHTIANSATTLNVGGRDLTDYLLKILIERGYCVTDSSEREIWRDIKEKRCYVALDFEAELKRAASPATASEVDRSYELPDGNIITVFNERFRCPEVLFRPSLVGVESPGVHEKVFETIAKCEIELRRMLYSNVVLSGGSSLFEGFAERLSKELTQLSPGTAHVKVIAPAERKYSAWIGGSILASLSTFRQLCITAAEYEEHGPSLIHRKCM